MSAAVTLTFVIPPTPAELAERFSVLLGQTVLMRTWTASDWAKSDIPCTFYEAESNGTVRWSLATVKRYVELAEERDDVSFVLLRRTTYMLVRTALQIADEEREAVRFDVYRFENDEPCLVQNEWLLRSVIGASAGRQRAKWMLERTVDGSDLSARLP